MVNELFHDILNTYDGVVFANWKCYYVLYGVKYKFGFRVPSKVVYIHYHAQPSKMGEIVHLFLFLQI